MIVTCIHVYVKTAHIDDFIYETRKNHESSVREPGNLRFDVLQDAEDPAKFTLYEAYESEEAVTAHKKTNHYLHWREAVADWMAKPRQGVKHKVICPEKKEGWIIADR